MGASLGGGGSRDSRRYRKQRFTEINVTPMVDVMLVLLIIFMVAAPMLTAGVQVELPKAKSEPLQGQDEPLTVSVKKDGKIYVGENPVTLEELGAKLTAIVGEKKDTRVFLRGDGSVDYSRMMKVMGEINAAGLSKVALITEQLPGGSTRREK